MENNKKMIRDISPDEVFVYLGDFFVKKNKDEWDIPFLPVFCVQFQKGQFFIDQNRTETIVIYPNVKVSCVQGPSLEE